MLFHDPRLSKSGAISCASCHNLSLGGADGRPTSIGHGWSIGPRNAPTVLNAALHIAQFWDGRAKDVRVMAKVQLGRVLSQKEAGKVAAFLRSLTSEIPAGALTLPTLPPSAPSTSRPDAH